MEGTRLVFTEENQKQPARLTDVCRVGWPKGFLRKQKFLEPETVKHIYERQCSLILTALWGTE